MIKFIFGTIIGAMIGIIVMALLFIADEERFNRENYKEPCRYRYQGRCIHPTSKWYGNKVTRGKCDNCRLYRA